ncbi:ATP-binding protein [Rhizobium sp. ICMP 5592]|uniref:ATP-binding protein n=1 Tax=Rhizobium sp. ICMP 5592 TaxID=2292445 RepID=UPI0012980AE5|nr:ATP-binding protein [Rhizobium sp. ICMP 5592]MQB43193.1 ATP-binding protein [Rhizobium sp. ICMP 5592]
MTAPTFLGRVGSVAGSTVSVRQAESVASGISIIGGRSYRVGQVGSFVRIPQGYHDLYGVISEVGAQATPETLQDARQRGESWMTVQLVGEIVETSFERGISQYPGINDEVHLVTEDDLARIYGVVDAGQITIGRLAGAESIPVRIDLDRLVTRHSAVLGSTGSGKSTTIASLLRSICSGGPAGGCASARILLIDIHGEYGDALKSVAAVFRVNPTGEDEKPLYVPYWAMDTLELVEFLMGSIDERPSTGILDKIQAAKLAVADGVDGIDINALTVNTPLPFSLKQLWFELIEPEYKTWADKERTKPAIEEEGNAETLKPPKYKAPGAGSALPDMNTADVLNIRRQLTQMRSRLLDRQYDFMLHPGEWEPDLKGKPEKDLPELLESWFGHDKPITVLDLSGVPSQVLIRLIGGILNITYEALFWGRSLPEGGRARPGLVVMEEAHRYLGKDSDNPARDMVQRIVKEGRKFGVGAMIVSQRPSEIDETILSQCGTLLALRLSNSADQAKVKSALPDSLSGLVDTLPVLRTGEAIVMGEAARLPIRCRIDLPPEGSRPNSEDPPVSAAWAKPRGEENYDRLAAAWRSQDPKWGQKPKGEP